MNTKATDRERSKWMLVFAGLVSLALSAGTALMFGAIAAWIWAWGEVGWRAMRWLLGVQ